MNGKQVAAFLKTFKGLFEFSTAEQVKLIEDRIGAYDYDPAVAVLKSHAATHEKLSIPNLLEGLRTDSIKRQERRITSTLKTVADGLKYHARTDWGVRDYENLNDEQTIYAHYSVCWQKVEDDISIDDFGSQYARRLIFAFAEMGLRQINKNDADARTIALEIVGLPPDYKFGSAKRPEGPAKLFEFVEPKEAKGAA